MGNGGSDMEVKLHFGCGDIDKHSEGYINIDARKLPHVDMVADVSQKLPYEDNTVDEILAESVLEHIPHNFIGVPCNFKMSKTMSVLQEWYRILKDGGKLVLRVPNIEAIFHCYINKTISTVDLVGYLWGNSEYAGNRHLAGFDVPILSACLKCAGFNNIKFVAPHDYKSALQRDASWEMGVIAIKGDENE